VTIADYRALAATVGHNLAWPRHSSYSHALRDRLQWHVVKRDGVPGSMCMAFPRLNRAAAPRLRARLPRTHSNFPQICRSSEEAGGGECLARCLVPIWHQHGRSAHPSYSLKGGWQLGVLRVRCILDVGSPVYSPEWKTLGPRALVAHREGVSVRMRVHLRRLPGMVPEHMIDMSFSDTPQRRVHEMGRFDVEWALSAPARAAIKGDAHASREENLNFDRNSKEIGRWNDTQQ
jgi:hypothetical protein